MEKVSRICLLGIAITGFVTIAVPAATTYQLDNGSIRYPVNASDGTEPHDNWFGNVFTALAGAERITRVDFGVYTTTPGSSGSVVLYRVTDPGGNPAAGATRVYTQAFTPLTGDGTNAFLQQINLTTPVSFNAGDMFLVAVFIRNVIALPPNDKYPYLLDTSGTATGTYWDRSTPNTFNLDDLSGARPINQVLTAGGWAPDAGHIFIRAVGVEVPKPSVGGAQPAVWNANISETFLNVRGSPVVVGQVAVNLTQPGRVLVQFDGDCSCDVGDRIVLAASDTPNWGANDGNESVKAASATVNGESFSHSRVYEVSAGPHTFYAVAQNYVNESGSGRASIYGTLKVRFFPLSGNSAFVDGQGISQTGINLRGAPVTLGTVTIQAPVSGRVIAHFDGECISSVGDRIVLAASDTPNWGVNDGNVAVKAVSASVDSQTFSHSRVYAVTAGSHTFFAVAQNYVDTAGTGTASIYGTLTVEFMPDSPTPPLLAGTGIADTLVNLRGSPVTLATLTLQAPTAGDVVVHFDGFCDSDVGDLIVLAASNTQGWLPNDGNVSVESPSAAVRMQCFSHSRIYHVSAGPQSFYAIAQNYVHESGSGMASVYGTLTAEFFSPVPYTLRAVFVPSSTLKVQVWGPSGGSGRVQRSTDLIHWTDWQSITLATQPLEIIDPDSGTTPYRFYRVISP